MRVLLAYVPVLHAGYRQLFEKWAKQVHHLYVIGPDLIAEFDHLERKNPQAIHPSHVVRAIQSWNLFRKVRELNYAQLSELQRHVDFLAIPREDETIALAAKYFPHITPEVDDIFLRWDRSRTLEQKHINPNAVISTSDFDLTVMNRAFEAAEMASDWYRQVGAIVVKDGEVVAIGHNTHMPSPHTNYALGSPRSFFKKGINLELTTDDHAEPEVIGYCAAEGIPLRGAWLYVTTFTCPPCAKLVRKSGFSRLYFSEGYAMLDGETSLRQAGVEIIQVVRP